MKYLIPVLMTVLLASCNKDEYFPTSESIAGIDLYCGKAADEACVANRDLIGGTTGGGTTGGSTGGDPAYDVSIQDAIASKCANVNPDDMFIKNLIKKDQVVGQLKKVKICHFPHGGHELTLLVACPALNGHKNHNDDLLGVCPQ